MLSTLFTLALLSLLALPALAAARVTREDIVRSFPAERAHRYRKVLTATNQHSAASTVALTSALTYGAAAPTTPGLWLPTDFGADPLGVRDSSDAFDALLSGLLSANHSHRLASGIIDLGGATIDLQGGDYLISRPLVIPFCYGNVRLQRGTVRASPTFPNTSSLLIIGTGSTALCKPDGQGTTLENVAVAEMMFDGSQRAAQCITIANIMGAVLGPNSFYLGFTQAGVSVRGGHEVQIENSWFGQYVYSDPRKEQGSATGIELLGNDHVVNNVVVYSARWGIYVTGAANLIYNAHTWNDATGTGNGGLGIFLDAGGNTQNRLIGVYLDFTDVLVVDPALVVIAQSFFLGGGAVRLKATKARHAISGLVVRDNEFYDGQGGPAFKVDESEAAFTALRDCVLDGNLLDASYHGLTTRLTRRFGFTHDPSSPAAPHCFDLRDSLLFPRFNASSVQVTLHAPDASTVPPVAVVPGRASGVPADDQRSVCIALGAVPTKAATTFAVDVTVDQSQYTLGQPKRPAAAAPRLLSARAVQQ